MPPTEQANVDAVQKLLQMDFSMGRKPFEETRPWDSFLSNVSVPVLKAAKKKAKVGEDESEPDTPKRKFDRIAMSTGLKFMFMIMNQNLELKHDVLQFFSSMLRELEPLDFQGLDPVQSRTLDQLEQYLAESICKDADLQDLAHGFFNRVGSVLAQKEEKGNPQDVLDLFVGLVNVRGSLSTNVLLARILATKPELLTSKSLAELRKTTSFSHPWLRPEPGSIEELVLAWREMVSPKLKRKFSSDPQQAAKKLEEVEKLLRKERTEEARAAVSGFLSEGDGASAALQLEQLPTRESLAAQREQRGVPPAERALSSLADKLRGGGQCDKLEACSVVLALLHAMADRAALPPNFTKKDLTAPPLPHLVGGISYLRSVCDLLSVIPPEILSSCSPEHPAASQPSYAAVVHGVLSVLRLNLEWVARRGQLLGVEGAEGATAEEKEAYAVVEQVLRSVILQEGEHAGASVLGGERGRGLAADAYSIGMPFFFNSPKAILQVLEPLMEQVREDKTANSPLRLFCSTIVSRIARTDLLVTLLKAEEESAGSGAGGGALAPMLDALVGFVTLEAQACQQSGVPAAAMWAQLQDVQDGGGSEVEVEEEWVWSTYNRQCISVSNGGLACEKTGGDPDYSVALGSVPFSEGKHLWEIKIINQRSMFVGVGPSSVDVDRMWSTGMIGLHNGGEVKGPNGDELERLGVEYSDGDIMTLVLDFEEEPRGRLEFWHNGALQYTAANVLAEGVTEVYPMVQFDYDDKVQVRKQVQILGSTERPEREHLAVACSGIAGSTLALLAQELDSASASAAMCRIAAAVCACLLKRLSDFLDLLAASGAPGRDSTLLPMFDGLLGFSSRGAPRHLLGFFPLVAVVAQRVLAVTGNKMSGSDLADAGLTINSMVALVTKLHSFLSQHPDFLASYTGRCFRSFALSGIQPHNANSDKRLAEITLTEELAGPWTMEILAKRIRTEENGMCEHVLLGLDSLELQLCVRNHGRGAQVVLSDTDNDTNEKFEKILPLDTWVSLCLVNTGEATKLFIDGTFGGCVERKFPLLTFYVGNSESGDEGCGSSFHGMVRSIRLWNRALRPDEVAGVVVEGEEAATEGWVATVDLVSKVSSGSAAGASVVPDMREFADKNFAACRGACVCKLLTQADDEDSSVAGPAEKPEDVHEPHWLVGLMQSLNGIAAVRATGMVRGERQSEEDAACQSWMRAPIFGQGIGAVVLEQEAVAAAEAGTAGVLSELEMPKFGLRASPALDAMERVIIVAALHHCGFLGKVMSLEKSKWPPSMLATCTNIARAARGVRRHVQTRRDLANQALKDNEEPQPWEVFCQPIVDKCKLLLRVPSMCQVEESLAAKTALAASAFAEAGKAKAVATAAAAFKSKGLGALHAHVVYRRMWSQGLGKSREKKVMDGVQGFLKDDAVDHDQLLKVAALQMGHVSQVQEGLAALVALVQMPRELQHETLLALARSDNAEKHYLEDLLAVGKPVEEDVRKSFYRLCELLVDLLRSEDKEVAACAAAALTVKLDRPDLSQLLASDVMEEMDALLRVDSAVWQGWGEALPSISRLLCSLLLQVGVHAQRLEAKVVEKVLESAFSLMQEASDAALLSVEAEHWFCADEGSVMFLSLRTEQCGLSVQNQVKGSARFNGEEYAVQGFRSTDGKYKLTLVAEGSDPWQVAGESSAVQGPANSQPEHRCLELRTQSAQEDDTEAMSLFRVSKPLSAPEIAPRPNVEAINGLVFCDDKNEGAVAQIVVPVSPECCFVQVQICGPPAEVQEVDDDGTNVELGLASEGFEPEDSLLGRSEESMAYLWHTDEVLCGEPSREETEASTPETAEHVRSSIAIDDILSCSVGFDGSVPTSVEWRVNGTLMATRAIPESLASNPLHFALSLSGAVHAVVLSSAPYQGGEPARQGVRKPEMARGVVRQLLEALRQVGHTPAVKRALVRREWRDTLWKLVLAPGLDERGGAQQPAGVDARANALAVLACSLEKGLMSEEEVAGTVRRVLSMLVELSPEARVLDFLPAPGAGADEAWPCLPLRRQMCGLLRRCIAEEPTSGVVVKELVGALRADAPRNELLGAVLAAGGALDQATGADGEGGEESPGVDAGVVEALLLASAEVLRADDFEFSLDGCVVRTRMLKALWDLSTYGSVQNSLAKRPELLSTLVALAQRRSLVPIMMGVQTEASMMMLGGGGQPKLKPNDDVMTRIEVVEEGVCYSIKDCSLLLDKVMAPGSGKYYAEFLLERSCGDYFFIGVASSEDFPESRPLASSNNSWGWANDGDFKVEGSWDSAYMTRIEDVNARFQSGDVMGMLVNMDDMSLTYTKNGEEIGGVGAGKIRSIPLRAGVGSSDTHQVRLVPVAEMRWREGAQFARGGAAGPPLMPASGPWLTMEALIAKSHALCVEVGNAAADAVSTSAREPSSAAPEGQDPLGRMLCLGHAAGGGGGSDGGEKEMSFPASEEALLPKASTSSRAAAKDASPQTLTVSAWPTVGNKTKLLLDTEEALTINYSRLVVLRLLQAGVAPLCESLDAKELVELILPLFPPGTDSGRQLFLSGPYESLVTLLDDALVGWIQARSRRQNKSLVEALKQLTGTCLSALHREALVSKLLRQGISQLSGVMEAGEASSAPSVVTWLMPKKWPVTTAMPSSEKALRVSSSMALAGWLSRHLFKDYGLGGRGECGSDLGSLTEGLLEALALTDGADARKKFQDSLSVAIPGCGSRAAASWGSRVLGLLRQLRKQMLMQLRKEMEDTRSVKRVLFTPLLQSLAATVVAADLTANGMRLRSVVEGFKEAMSDAAPSAEERVSPHLVNQLKEFGYSESHVQLALSAMGFPKITGLDSGRSMELLDKLGESEEELAMQVEQNAAEGGASLDEASLRALRKAEALAVLSQVLRCLHDGRALPVAFVDVVKAEGVQEAEVHSWDDRDGEGGMQVRDGCRRACRRRGVPVGEWGYVTGNAPLSPRHPFASVRVERKKRHWASRGNQGAFSGAYVGVMLLDGELSTATRRAVAAKGFSRGCVVWRAMAKSITVCDGKGGTTTVPCSKRFTLGSIVGIHLNRAEKQVEFFLQDPGGTEMEKVACAPLPLSSLAAVPFLSLNSDDLLASFTNAAAEVPRNVSGQSGGGSVLQPLAAFPCRNTVSQRMVEWDAALDPEWTRALDALLAEFAVQHAQDNKMDNPLQLSGEALFPETEDELDEGGVALQLERQPSRLPPTVRTASFLSAPSADGQPPKKTAKETDAPNLSMVPPRVLRGRWAVLKALNRIAADAVKLVDLRRFEESGSVAHILCLSKALLLPETKTRLFDKSVSLSGVHGDPPEIVINRGTSPAESRKLERTIVWQMMTAVEERRIPFTVIGGRGDSKQAWKAAFSGEGGMDYGGLYRDSLREMCAELQCREGALQLLVPCPNQRMSTGSCQDRWLPNPGCTSAVHLRLFRFVGMLMGASVRTDACIELDLPGMVWKQLVGEECTREDVAAVDEVWSKEVQSCLGVETKQEWEARERFWTVKSCTARVDELVAGGAQRRVRWEEREAFVEAQVKARVGECRAQVAAMQEGFTSVVPGMALPLLTWRELERRVVGTAVIDVGELEKNTEYQSSLSKEHPLIIKFWKVVKTFSQPDLAAFLAFVWGRKRMPVPNSGDHLKIDLLSSRGDAYLPQAHTCFFAVDLPEYSSEAVMKEKLMYAIYGCAAIDNDTGNPNGTLYESDEESETEEAAAEYLSVIPNAESKPEKDALAESWLSIPLDCGDGDVDMIAQAAGTGPVGSGSVRPGDATSDENATTCSESVTSSDEDPERELDANSSTFSSSS